MSIKPDSWIRTMAREKRMIMPFQDCQVSDDIISYGVSSYGYDIRIADEFKIFTNVRSTVVDPKSFDENLMDRNEHVRALPLEITGPVRL